MRRLCLPIFYVLLSIAAMTLTGASAGCPAPCVLSQGAGG